MTVKQIPSMGMRGKIVNSNFLAGPIELPYSDNIDRVSDDFIQAAQIVEGSFDNVGTARYAVPSHWDIGKVYKRLILGIAKAKGLPVMDALMEAYDSFVSDKIDDYNSSFYYEAPEGILQV